MNTQEKLPLYVKASLLMIGSYFFISMLSIAQEIILPLIYATIIAILMSPVVNFLIEKKIIRILAVTITLAITVIIISLLIILVFSQAGLFIHALPQLSDKFQELLNQTVLWASGYFNINVQQINDWIIMAKAELIHNSSSKIGNTLTTMSGILVAACLTPVYVFLILFYQPHLVRFVHKLFGENNSINISEILIEIKTIIQSYLAGLFGEFVIIAVLSAVGLLLLGIDYAIILGLTGAFLNIIPYIGGIIGVVLYMIIALITKSPVYILYVFLLYGLIQFIDNYYIVPKVVGSKVKLNALVSIIVVIAGAALWGIPGMFLSIPLTAIIKLIFDRIEPLKPWGFLLGDTMPPIIDLGEISKKIPRILSTVKKKNVIPLLFFLIPFSMLIMNACKSPGPYRKIKVLENTTEVVEKDTSSVPTVYKPLTLIIKNLVPQKSPVNVVFYKARHKFLSKTDRLKGYQFISTGNVLTVHIADLKYGEFAIATYQDVNNNKKCDKSIVGIPKEPYGFSNNFRPHLKAPCFDDCKFAYHADSDTLTIVMMR